MRATVKSVAWQGDVNLELCSGFVTVRDDGFTVYTVTPAERPERAKPQLQLRIYDHRIHVQEALRRYRGHDRALPLAEIGMYAFEAIQVPARAVVVRNRARDPRADWFHVNLVDPARSEMPQVMLYSRIFTPAAPGEVRDSRAFWLWSRAFTDGIWRHALVALTDAEHPLRVETVIAGVPRYLTLGARADLERADPCGEEVLDRFSR